MKEKIKKISFLVLILCMIFGSANQAFATNFADENTKLPEDIKWFDKDSKLRLNLDLYYSSKHLVVYGDYTLFGVKNDFKQKANGFYTKDGKKGEYRYHGYTLGGSIYANTDFPEDEVMKNEESSYRYIPRIWERGNKYYRDSRLREPSNYTYIATSNDPEIRISQQEYQRQINSTAPYTLSKPLYGDGIFHNYANVETMSTFYNSGDFRLDHLATYKDGSTKLWYVCNSLKKLEVPLKHNPVKAEFIKSSFLEVNPEATTKKETAKFEIILTGYLQDDWLFDKINKNPVETDEILRQIYYERGKISHWEFKIWDNITKKENTYRVDVKSNKAQYKFTVSLPYETYKDYLTVENGETTSQIGLSFIGTATVKYVDGEKAYGQDTFGANMKILPVPPPPAGEGGGEVIIPPDLKPIYPELEEPFYMLDTEKFKLYDRTTENVVNRIMLFDGVQLSEEDEEKMLSGEWLFPLTGEHAIHTYEIFWYNELGREFSWEGFIVVYSTKAKVQVDVTGTYKENRKLVAHNNTLAGNPQYVTQRSSYEVLTFDVYGDGVHLGEKTNSKIEFLSKTPYEDIGIDLQVKCKVKPQYIERDDIPEDYHISNYYTYTLHVQPDHQPDIYCMVWNPILARNEQLQMTCDIASYDGDKITTTTYELYYDEDKDGVAEKLIKSGNVDDSIKKYKPEKLGMYVIKFYASEEFGELTLNQYITENDKKTMTIERQFYVENLAPSTQIYIDLPADYPQVDIVVLNDENITRAYNNNIVETRISFMNSLIRESLNPYVYIWDLYTYISTNEATTIVHSGASKPPATTSYTSGGYAGTLNKYDEVNNQEWEDHGRMVTKYVTETVTGEQNGWSEATYDSSGNMVGKPESSNQPTMDLGGVTGQKDSWKETTATDGSNVTDNGDGTKTIRRSYTAKYSARIKVPVEVWVPNMVLVDRWTGYYKGNIYKYVKQPFEAQYRDISNKYIVYFSTDTNITNMEDIQVAKNKADSKLILVGSNITKSKVSHDFYVDGTQTLEEIYKDIIEYISVDNPQERGSVVLIGEEFKTDFADVDQEGDKIQGGGFQVVHEKNYFDNPMLQEINTNSMLDEKKFTLTTLPTKFNNVGKYIFYRRIKDIPDNFEETSEYSNNAEYIVYAHRKPIARFDLDWEYNINTGYYEIEFIDKSYDLDLQYKDVEGKKGIRETKLKYKNKNNDNWIYSVPTKLLPGKYVVSYYVKDNYGVWSDVYTKEFVLPDLPPPQIDAKLKAELSNFSLSSIPASENLTAYDIWTRYPYDVYIKLGLATPYTTDKQLVSSKDVWKKDGQDMYWNNQTFNIPATVKSGLYTFKVRAIDTVLASKYAEILFNVNVKTPINLNPTLSSKITADKVCDMIATTSKYVNTAYSNSNVMVTMFYNTPYATTMKMNGSNGNWSKSFTPTKSVPENMYMARFVATLPSGEFEEKILYFQYVYNTPPNINSGDIFTGSVNINNNYIYENDDVNFTLYYNDVDLSPVTINIKLYNSSNVLLKELNTIKTPNASGYYDPYTTPNYLIENIPLGHYKIVATVTDDYNETATLQIPFEAHDLWVKGEVTHTTDWEKNRQTYNSKYPAKSRTVDTYWNGESLETSANTTVINIASLVKCNKVSVEIINNDKPSDSRYLQWLSSVNIANDKWKLSYWDKEWVSKDGNVIVKWGADKKQELTLRFTAYFNNEWVETYDVKIYIDNQDDYWKLHRVW